MNMTMTFDDFKGALILICVLSCCWSSYNSKHSDNKKIQAITSFWLGLMVYTVLFYIVFSWNK
ncbi:hypothetical protein C3745_07345 [Lactobacillus gasseri]|jgi:hypothetical protein|uniref:Bacteriocin immunity protein n=1 Tax=Lactobacillus gasseri TaxID=1596 RepID=A0AB33C5B4_LACGS|nr:hypothetical protein CCE30_10030 [Lactobacillus gasseri]RBQ00726.1 hypothetical protein C3745_07345 [Lactobacillus gasseri]